MESNGVLWIYVTDMLWRNELRCSDITRENANLLLCIRADLIKVLNFIIPEEIAVHYKFNLTVQWCVSW